MEERCYPEAIYFPYGVGLAEIDMSSFSYKLSHPSGASSILDQRLTTPVLIRVPTVIFYLWPEDITYFTTYHSRLDLHVGLVVVSPVSIPLVESWQMLGVSLR